MKQMRLTFALLVTLLICAVPVFSGDNTIAKPGVLGDETIFATARLSGYSTVIIKDFDVSHPEYENIDDEEKADIEPVVETLPKILSSNFVNELKSKNKYKKVLRNASQKNNAIIVTGKVTKISGGHGAAKFFLGWMAPNSAKTHIEVTGSIVDAKTGKKLAEFSDSKAGATGAAMGYLKEVLVNLSGDEGRDLAEFVEKLY